MKTYLLPLVAVLVAIPSAAQSLADLAKKAEEQSAKVAAEKKGPAKVITNDTLKPGRQFTEPTATEPPTATPGTSSVPPAASPATKTDQTETERSDQYRADA